jgi:hypothetical protein
MGEVPSTAHAPTMLLAAQGSSQLPTPDRWSESTPLDPSAPVSLGFVPGISLVPMGSLS